MISAVATYEHDSYPGSRAQKESLKEEDRCTFHNRICSLSDFSLPQQSNDSSVKSLEARDARSE
jgi:hypothetical protein